MIQKYDIQKKNIYNINKKKNTLNNINKSKLICFKYNLFIYKAQNESKE